MEDIINLIISIIGAFIIGMAVHSTLRHYWEKPKNES